MKKVTKEEVKKYVRDFIDIYNFHELYNCGFYINDFCVLDIFYNLKGYAHNLEYQESDYVFDATSYIRDYFSIQDLKYDFNDLCDIFYREINEIIDDFEFNDKPL